MAVMPKAKVMVTGAKSDQPQPGAAAEADALTP
jgi:hypothetical protein